MSTGLLTVLVVVPVVAVVVAICAVMWHARTSPATSRAAILGGLALAAWALTVTVIALRGGFRQPDGASSPPVGIALAVTVGVLIVALRASPSLRSLFTNHHGRVVLITGASSGVGQATARLLARSGYTVLGTSRNPSLAATVPAVEMVPLDVHDDESVRACVDVVAARTGRVDVLINNAGQELAGALEEISPEEVRAQFDINFFGAVRMVNAVLPLMRQQKRGHIINVGSLAGLVPIPFLGMYSAAKFALEGYTEALRHELRPLGIHVSLTEAGFLRTSMMNNRQSTARRIADYEPWRERALDAVREHEEKGPGPDLVARMLLEVVSSHAPRLRHLIGQQAKSVVRQRRFLPARMFERGLRRIYGLDR